MWIILPVKHLRDSKSRLKDILSDEQRWQFSYLMVMDTLQILCSSVHVQGVTMISSDQSLSQLAEQHHAEFILTDKDSGYSKDAMYAINALSNNCADKIAIIPTDLPQLSHHDIELLDNAHEQGVSLCAAEKDGGTNALVFTPPLAIPLLFGLDSCKNHQQAAKDRGVTEKIVQISGLQRDIDRPDDLRWLFERSSGGKAWQYIRTTFKDTVLAPQVHE
ncbi:MAG: 2-phospho-L-lactate guanylyltransferase [Gammaproteobacteria bacterium]|nr:2-phospho-L-lactate guanylyltransferase [Gammaproteobacteria bacterium]